MDKRVKSLDSREKEKKKEREIERGCVLQETSKLNIGCI